MSIMLQGNAFSNLSTNNSKKSTPAFCQGWVDVRPSVFQQSFPMDVYQFQTPKIIENTPESVVNEPKKEVQAPKIGMARVIFHRLTKEQIAEVNESRQLPKNAKFKDSEVSGEPRMTWNLLDWSKGTHTLPAGYEMKNDILGFTHVVREDTKAWWLKKN